MRGCHLQSQLGTLGPGAGHHRVTSSGLHCWEQEIRQRQLKRRWGWGGRAGGQRGAGVSKGVLAGSACCPDGFGSGNGTCRGRRDAKGEEMRVLGARRGRASCLQLECTHLGAGG